MKESSAVIIGTTVGIVVLFGLLSKLIRQGASAKEIRQIYKLVVKNLNETEATHRTLRRARGAVNQIHQYLAPGVTKGVENSAS